MIKKIISYSLMAVSMTTSFEAISSSKSAGEWTTPVRVTSVQIHDNSVFVVTTETQENTSSGCASANGAYWWPSTEHLSKEIYSTKLAAHASGKKISVVYADESNIQAKRITHIIVRDKLKFEL